MINLNLQNIKDLLFKIFDYFIKNFKNILIIFLVIYLLSLGNSYINTKNDLHNTSLNYIAAVDSLRISKNKIGDLTYSKNIYIKSIDELKAENNALMSEINKLNYSEKRHLIEIQKLKISISNLRDSAKQFYDTSYQELNQYKFNYLIEDQFRCLSGYTIIHSSCVPDSSFFFIEKDSIYADFTITKKEVKNGIELGVTSNNPYIKVNSLEGSIVNIDSYEKYQKPKKWGLGVGLGLGIGYDILNKNLFIGPTMSLQLNYNLITW